MAKETKQRKILPVWLYLLIYAGVAGVCIALDQITKHFMELHALNGGGDIPIIGDWLVMHFTRNPGATGSLFEDLSWRNWLFFVMTVVGLPVFGWLLWRSRTRSVWGQVAYSFIIGGTVGNAIDRLVFAEEGFFTGYVRDFIQVKHFFGIFNIADSCLVVGVIMALLAIVFFDRDSLLQSVLNDRKTKQSAQTALNGDEAKDAVTSEQNGEPDDGLRDAPAQGEQDVAEQESATDPDGDRSEHTDEND